jgi:hypothetical protein
MAAERLNHRIYNVSSGRLVRYSEVVAAINAAGIPIAFLSTGRHVVVYAVPTSAKVGAAVRGAARVEPVDGVP